MLLRGGRRGAEPWVGVGVWAGGEGVEDAIASSIVCCMLVLGFFGRRGSKGVETEGDVKREQSSQAPRSIKGRNVS